MFRVRSRATPHLGEVLCGLFLTFIETLPQLQFHALNQYLNYYLVIVRVVGGMRRNRLFHTSDMAGPLPEGFHRSGMWPTRL